MPTAFKIILKSLMNNGRWDSDPQLTSGQQPFCRAISDDITGSYSLILRQSPIKQQLVYGHLPLFDFPKQGVLPSAFWMEWISSAFFVLLLLFIPSFFAFFLTSSIFIIASLRYFRSVGNLIFNGVNLYYRQDILRQNSKIYKFFSICQLPRFWIFNIVIPAKPVLSRASAPVLPALRSLSEAGSKVEGARQSHSTNDHQLNCPSLPSTAAYLPLCRRPERFEDNITAPMSKSKRAI
jgi:hypothetical protein